MSPRKKLKPCGKKKFKEKVSVMYALAVAKKNIDEDWNRQEKRYYYCRQCHAYHLTSKDKLPFNTA